MKTLIVIVGPTGVGKTKLCLDIAKRFDTCIINADSRQIFRELPIGTAAPTADEQRQVKHFFVGNMGITDYYNASMFENDVMLLLDRLFTEKDAVVMSGGSMMYIDAVCKGIDDIPSIDEEVRKTLKERYEMEGLGAISEELRRLDPEYHSIVDRNNPKRVIHALEVCLSTGKTYTSFRRNTKKRRPFSIVKVGLNCERSELYARIDQRVDAMMSEGLLDEAWKVYSQRGLNALNAVGYKELFDYFDGLCTLSEALFKIKSNTHKYCRKQLTWFKHDEEIRWFHPDNIEEIIKYIATFL